LGKKTIEDNFKKMIRYCKVIRILVHSQVRHKHWHELLYSDITWPRLTKQFWELG
jgi:hypothetical protein